jgi:hypothetical protein
MARCSVPIPDENSEPVESVSPERIQQLYSEALKAFTTVLGNCMNTSRQAMQIAAGERRYWGSVLFTRIITVGTSILSLCPSSVMAETLNWDFASVASLVRNLYECQLMYFYLAIEGISDDEWRARLNVMQLHDHTERRKMLKDFGNIKFDDAQVEFIVVDLHTKLTTNPFFLSLQKHLQKELLKGTRATILTNKEISQRMGGSEQRTWAFYRFFSCHTHSTPLSFYRYAEQKRDGTENDIEKGYMSEALNFATQVVRRADSDYQKVFSDLVEFKPLKFMNWAVMKTKARDTTQQKAVPRNSPCSCGSGKKYRWCHGTSKAGA